MKIKFKILKSGAQIPEFKTAEAAGADLCACLDAPVTLEPMERMMIPLGFAMEIPEGFEAQIRARSGLAIKHGITLINGIGTIDADYRGEVGVLLVNLGTEPFEITPKMRIAQMVFARFETPKIEITETLTQSARGEGGFGSTGL
ncbi:MAG: dUTP diphosphatase [bacterium]|nr:dUTP diphosphatase [bacterium]